MIGAVLALILTGEAIALWVPNVQIARLLLMYAHVVLFGTLILCTFYDVCYVAPILFQSRYAPLESQELVGQPHPQQTAEPRRPPSPSTSTAPEQDKTPELELPSLKNDTATATDGMEIPVDTPTPSTTELLGLAMSLRTPSAQPSRLSGLSVRAGRSLAKFNSNEGILISLVLVSQVAVFMAEYQPSPSNLAFVALHHAKHAVTAALILCFSALCIFRGSINASV
jgi:hypothetical protein